MISALSNNTFTASTTYIDNQSPNYLDATDGNTFGGVDPTSISNPVTDHPPTVGDLSDLAELYAIEDKIGDGLDSAGFGLVRIQTGALYVTQQSETSSSGAVGLAVGFSGSGDTIEIQGGGVSYAGNIAIGIPLTIQGAGSSGVGATEISGTSGNILQIAASNVAIDDLIVSGTASTKGLYIDSTISGPAFTNVVATGNQAGLYLDNAADVTGMTLDHVSLIHGTSGLLVATTARVHGTGTPGTGIIVTSSHFDDNDYGWNVQADSGSATNELDFTDILVTGLMGHPTTFNHDARDGLYAEKLNNSTLEYIDVSASGMATDSPTPHGVDLNLKHGAFSTILIQHATLSNDGLGHSSVVSPGAGLAIDADPGYAGSATGISLNDVQIGGMIGCPVDLSIGDNVSGITMSDVQLTGQGLGLLYFATVAGGLNLGNTSFATQTGFILNGSPYAIDATNHATFSGLTTAMVPFTNFDTSTGDPTDPGDLDKYFAIEDNIIDAIDVAGAGLVRLRSGYQFVSNNSTENPSFQALVPSMSSIQNAVNVSSSGQTVLVQDGLYTESNILISHPLTIQGQSCAVIVAPAAYDGHDDSTYGVSAQQGFQIASSDVTIKTLTIDGNANPALTLQSQNFRNAVLADTSDGWSTGNLTVNDVSIKNIFRKGVALYSSGGVTTGNVVSNSSFDSIGTDAAVGFEHSFAIASFSSSGSIFGNTITNFSGGIGSNFLDGNPAHGPLLLVHDNSISSPAAATGNPTVGLDLSGLADGSDIYSNPINMTGGHSGGDLAIVVQFTAPGADVSVHDNSSVVVDGSDTGIYLYYDADLAHPVLVDHNTVTGAAGGAGIVVTDDGTIFGETPHVGITYATLTGNTISGFGTGILVTSAGSTTVSATIGGTTNADSNSIAGATSGTGIAVVGAHSLADIANNDGSIHGFAIGIDVNGGVATISNNHIDDNTTGIRFTAGGSGSVDTNDFTGTPNLSDIRLDSNAGVAVTIGDGNQFAGSHYFIDNRSANAYDFSTYTSTSFAGLSTAVLADDFSIEDRMYHALDNPASGLIRWVAGKLYVTTPGTGYSDETISNAITAADPNDAVYIDQGTFDENLRITKSLTLLGAKAGVAGVDGSRGTGETIVRPSISGASPYSGVHSTVITLLASGITIDGLTIDGNNSNLAGGIALTGAGGTLSYAMTGIGSIDSAAQTGTDISVYGNVATYAPISGVTLLNNVIQNIAYQGIDLGFGSSAGASGNSSITHNLIQNVGAYEDEGTGVRLYNDTYAHVDHNTLTNVRMGIETGNFHQANPGAMGSATIDDNSICRGAAASSTTCSAAGHPPSRSTAMTSRPSTPQVPGTASISCRSRARPRRSATTPSTAAAQRE